ncbi:unnamed protein product [Caenorhabditis auriculariae]|uniref:G-protein coupled receptors family 1 profile domain-containing protein n=1 Tax=Caenorhabditis auriculariae TaxID=2777116 RepID=A0A8S1H8V5_9PELO|nr:unnamed protein product [Caenorhabditis auriculariae]
MLQDNETSIFLIQDDCAPYETYTPIRFVLISIATVIACLGTVANVLLAYLFCSKKSSTTPATLYPTILAFLDVAICFEYILLFGVDAIVSFLRVEGLFTLYYIYIIPAYVASRITQLAIPYMLIFATLERLYWSSSETMRNKKTLKAFHSTQGRHITVTCSFLACCLLRVPTAFAMMVADYPDCPDFFRTMTTMPRDWVHHSTAYNVFDLHVMTIAQTIVPFFLLVGLNVVIVHKMLVDSAQKEAESVSCFSDERMLTPISHKSSTNIGISLPPLKSMSASVRSAVFTMAAIVASYLISNILHLILTFLERAKHPVLQSVEDPLLSSTFHTFFSDLVSFVYMFTSAIRILIYYGCNPRIRDDLNDFFASRKSAVYL